MIVLEYPVALVLKGWHMLLTGVLGLDSAQAWLFALFMLVITIRGLLVPVAYRQFRATRISTNLRPKMQALEKSYEERHDAESRREYRQKLKELKKAHNYSMADGCIPAFIQIPAFIGLYRLLLAVLRQIELAPEQRHAIGPHRSSNT